jgi:hypothetical protein
MKVTKELKDMCVDFLLERTKLRKDELEAYDGRVEDWYFGADESIKLGIAHHKMVMHKLTRQDIQEGNFRLEE